MSDWETKCQQDARLAILAELARQKPAPTLNVLNLTRVVEALGVRRPREWVETQLSWLENMGAVNLQASDLPGLGKVIVATLTRTGRDHVDQRNVIAGVTLPADQE